jgi:hypothetical protein
MQMFGEMLYRKKKIKDSLLVILQLGACQVPMENLRYVKLYKHL